MKILDKIADSFGYTKQIVTKSVSQVAEAFRWSNILGQSPSDMSKREYLTSAKGWVYACTSAIAEEVASIKFRLFEISGKKETKEVDQHPLLDLLHRANDLDTKTDFWYKVQGFLELSGEAPILLAKDTENTPVSMYLLLPHNLTIEMGVKKGESIVARYKYRSSEMTEEKSFKADEILFIKKPRFDGSFRGIGTLAAAAKTVDIDNFSEEYNRMFFYNSAKPDFALEFPPEVKLTTRQKKDIQRQIQQNYGGIKNSRKTIILERGVKLNPLTISRRDMDFIEQQRFSRDKIMAIFRVPKSSIGIVEDVNRANAEASDYVFSKRTIKPKMTMIVDQLNEFLVPMFEKEDSKLLLTFDDPVAQDELANSKIYSTALKSGYLSPNEIREKIGKESVKGGDQLYLPANLIPVGATPESKKSIVPANYRYRMQEKRNDIQEELKEKIVKIMKSQLRMKEKKKVDKKLLEAAHIKQVSHDEANWTKDIKDLFSNQEKRVLKGLSQKSMSKPIDIEKEDKIFVEVLDPLEKDLVQKRGRMTLFSLGIDADFNLDSPAVRKFISERPHDFAHEVNDKTFEDLKDAINAGVAEGEGIIKIKKRIKDIYAGYDSNRAELIARSEVIRGSNFATEQAYIQSEVVEAKEWLVTEDDRLCEFCRPMQGRTMGLGKSFYKKNSTIIGEDGGAYDASYEDIQHPPLHPRCRCTLIPVIKD